MQKTPVLEELETVHTLIVDDDVFSRKLLRLQLEINGYEVAEAADGETAYDLLMGEHNYDVVLLDINLPEMSGLDLLEKVRLLKSPIQLPIILVSALSQREDVVRGLELGANDYVTKPIEVQTLLARVSACAMLKRSLEDLIGTERQRVMIESLGAACHHIAQPLTAAMGWMEHYVENIPNKRASEQERLEEIMCRMKEAAKIVHAMQDVREYRTTPYYDEQRIVDLGLSLPDPSVIT